MVLSAELSAAVLFVDSYFDCSELRVERVSGRVSGGGAKGCCTFIGRRGSWHRQKACLGLSIQLLYIRGTA